MKKLYQLGISPAPWSIVDFCASHYCVASSCGYRTSDTRRLEDASLIAAAPELYECLREAVNDQCHDCDHRDDDFNCHNGCYCKIWKWRAALSKAAGEEEWK